jgi:predicted Zn finger-like uncharacterized protein
MQFSCEKCSTRYSVPDEKVRGKRIRTKCRKCGSEILVEGPTEGGAPPVSVKPSPPSVAPPAGPKATAPRMAAPMPAAPAPMPAAPAPAARAEDRWTVAVGRDDQRKMTTAEVVDAYATGTINAGTLVWKQGMEKWQPPFDVPAIALALGARGFTLPPAVATHRPPPIEKPAVAEKPAAPPSSAADWDNEDEATRVVDGSLRFPGRPTRISSQPPPVAPKGPSPAAALPPPAMPKPAPRMPVVPAAPAPFPPAPSAPKAAPAPPAPKASPLAPSPTKRIERPAPAPSPIEDLPSSDVASADPSAIDKLLENTMRGDAKALVNAAFDFEGESTAVIAPDRAKELLEAEAAKSDARQEAEETAGGATAEIGSETPLGFGFDDDESTKVIAPEKAQELLSVPTASEAPPAAAIDATKTPLAVVQDQPGGRTKVITARADAHPPPAAETPASVSEKVGSVVVDQPGTETRQKPPASPPAPKPPGPPKAPLPSLPSAKPLPGMANEPTRVVRVKKKADTTFWVVLFFALAAAAAGGFVASEMLRHGPAPSWLKKR